jgi:predicted nucleotidyltransferase
MSDASHDPPTFETLRARREEILKLAEEHGAYNVRVFGSVARGETTPESDIDFLVRWDYGRVSAWGGVGLDLDLEALLGHSVDVVSENGLSPLLKEAQPL